MADNDIGHESNDGQSRQQRFSQVSFLSKAYG